jgi:type III secretion system-like peptide-binding chaperone
MEPRASADQVAEILRAEGIEFVTRPDGLSHQLQFGSAAVFLDFHAGAHGWIIITIYSPILQEIDPRVPESAEGLGFLNDLNRGHDLVKFSYADNALFVEYDLLGDTLHPNALRYGIAVVAEVADSLDDELAGRIGGKRFVTALKEYSDAIDDSE